MADKKISNKPKIRIKFKALSKESTKKLQLRLSKIKDTCGGRGDDCAVLIIQPSQWGKLIVYCKGYKPDPLIS